MRNTAVFGILLGASALVAAGSLQDALAVGSQNITATRNTNFGGLGGGGEFHVPVFNGMTPPAMGANAAVSGSVFQTFCMEPGEAIVLGTAYNWTLSDSAHAGGAGAVNGADPICAETAYLYTQFWNGVLTDYDYTPGTATRRVSAYELQSAIWFLEQEDNFLDPNDANDAQALAWIAEAQDAIASGSWSGIGDVRVLTLTTDAGAAIQDLIVRQQTPSLPPGLKLTKSATPNPAEPYEPVTYSYVVENTGGVNLTNVVVTDDNGTPGNTLDDFQLGPVSIAVGGSHTFTKTLIPTVELCATIAGVPNTPAGTLQTQFLGNGDIQVTYTQDEGVNDNRYGTGATAATGWPGGHKFSHLTGSDQCEFRFKDANGVVVLDFRADCLTAATSKTFPSGTVNYPSGYGTLGADGGDGGMITGSVSNVLLVRTAISDNFRLPQFQSGFFVNSPPETAPMSGISIPAGWDYKNSYTVVIKGSTFGSAGFGSVEIPDQHNSPAKEGENSAVPHPCDTYVTNIAVATATAVGSGVTVSATDNETVFIDAGTGPHSGGGGGGVSVSASITKFDKKKMAIALKNTGTTTVTIGTLQFDWPAGNQRLLKIKKGATVLFDTPTNPTSVTVSTWLGKLEDRQIKAGDTKTLTFEFEANANTTASNYDLSIDFGGGLVVLLQ